MMGQYRKKPVVIEASGLVLNGRTGGLMPCRQTSQQRTTPTGDGEAGLTTR